MKKLLYFAQKLSISPIFSKTPFSYKSDFGRYHPCPIYEAFTIQLTTNTVIQVTPGGEGRLYRLAEKKGCAL